MNSQIASVLEATGLAIFIWYLFRSLSSQVKGLQALISTQKETIEVMSQRIAETEKIGGLYKQLLSDLPGDLDNYKKIMSATKDTVIVELRGQYEETRKKLEHAHNVIADSGMSSEKIERHLNILRRLMTHKESKYGEKEELHLKKVVEFKFGAIEKSISFIEKSTTLKEMLQAIGLSMHIAKDDLVINEVFRTGALPDGTHLGAGFATQENGINGAAWMIVAEDGAWFNEAMFHAVSDELHFVKHMV